MSARGGGQAFPRAAGPGWPQDDEPVEGMSLLDYFAAHAPPYPFAVAQGHPGSGNPNTPIAVAIAEWNYDYAAAMLLERAK